MPAASGRANYFAQLRPVARYPLCNKQSGRSWAGITSGASCPDALVEAVIRKIAGYYATPDQREKMVAEF
ncbi:MAG TPA: hypothetical protein VGN00_14495 [Puia sp.]|jgi:hypothetical protein